MSFVGQCVKLILDSFKIDSLPRVSNGYEDAHSDHQSTGTKRHPEQGSASAIGPEHGGTKYFIR
jgi:hypothetical protein